MIAFIIFGIIGLFILALVVGYLVAYVCFVVSFFRARKRNRLALAARVDENQRLERAKAVNLGYGQNS